jgi:hypothetical protein
MYKYVQKCIYLYKSKNKKTLENTGFFSIFKGFRNLIKLRRRRDFEQPRLAFGSLRRQARLCYSVSFNQIAGLHGFAASPSDIKITDLREVCYFYAGGGT